MNEKNVQKLFFLETEEIIEISEAVLLVCWFAARVEEIQEEKVNSRYCF